MKGVISKFLQENDKGGPLILGFSGGGDSMALLHLLLELGVKNLHLAHFDHGWRVESQTQAENLSKYAEKLGVPFWVKRGILGNQGEEKARGERLAFFAELFEKLRPQAILLAHQQEDLAETVLKRLFEGGALSCMRPISLYDGMPIWRPLLDVGRKELRDWLAQRGIPWIEDETNRDRRYLRGKMREELFPVLEKEFGKKVVRALAKAAKRASELEEYLARQVEHIEGKEEFFGLVWVLPKEKVHARFFLQRLLRERGLCWSADEIERALTGTGRKLPNNFFADRGRLYELEKWVVPFRGTVPLGKGYFFAEPRSSAPLILGGTLGKFWNNQKVPSFLRPLMPVVMKGDMVVCEYISGKNWEMKSKFRVEARALSGSMVPSERDQRTIFQGVGI